DSSKQSEILRAVADATPLATAHAPAHNPGVATWRPLRLPTRNPQPTKDLRRQQRKSSVRCGWLQLCVVDPAPALRRSEQARTDFPGSGRGRGRGSMRPASSVWMTEGISTTRGRWQDCTCGGRGSGVELSQG